MQQHWCMSQHYHHWCISHTLFIVCVCVCIGICITINVLFIIRHWCTIGWRFCLCAAFSILTMDISTRNGVICSGDERLSSSHIAIVYLLESGQAPPGEAIFYNYPSWFPRYRLTFDSLRLRAWKYNWRRIFSVRNNQHLIVLYWLGLQASVNGFNLITPLHVGLGFCNLVINDS